MKHPAFSLVVLAVLLSAVAANGVDFTKEQLAQLEKHEFQASDGQKLPYRLYKPEGLAEGEKYPLIVFLHGGGERGTDNEQHIRGCGLQHLIFSEEGQKNKPFFVAPQCPPDARWTEGKGLDGTPLKRAHELVEQIKKTFPIDEKRVYVTGPSMGGFGTWDWLRNYADETAAAIPVCGWINVPSLCAVPGVKNKPIWIFHGDADPAVPVRCSRDAYAALQKVTPNVKYTEYPGVKHNAWVNAYREEELPKWMFQQKLGETPNSH